MNEIIFLFYILTVSTFALIALKISKEALIALICMQAIFANLFVTKQITLFGLHATATDALAVGATLSLNLLQEFYQRAITQKTIWISFFCTLFYLVISIFQITYIPAITDSSSVHFQAILKPMPRILAASLFVYLFVQHIDCRFYGYLCKRFEYRNFILRNYSSVMITQFIDTFLFSFLGLWKINESFSSIATIFQIIVVSYIIKLFVILIAAPYLSLSKKIIKL